MARMPSDKDQRLALRARLAAMVKAWEESLRVQEDAAKARQLAGRNGPQAAAVDLAETSALVERLRIAEERSRVLDAMGSGVLTSLYETHNILTEVYDTKREAKIRFGRLANGLPGPSWHRILRLARLGYIVLVRLPSEDAYKIALTRDGHGRVRGDWRL